jgi:type VI secretion system protein VasJ
MGQDSKWLWAAHGKHPSTKDFFSIGSRFPLVSVFSEWIKKGYPPLAEAGKQAVRGCSWRFWARGGVKGELACGLLRDSHDCFGRPYPLLIMGTGQLPCWEEHWNLLPEVCEKLWCRIELVSARRFGALGELEEELGKIRPPGPEWSDCGSIPGRATGGAGVFSLTPQIQEKYAEVARNTCDKEMGCIRFGNDDANDIHALIMHLNSVLKSNVGKAPNTLFIGGTNNETALFFFRRPMRPDDLLTLWGVQPGN